MRAPVPAVREDTARKRVRGRQWRAALLNRSECTAEGSDGWRATQNGRTHPRQRNHPVESAGDGVRTLVPAARQRRSERLGCRLMGVTQ